MPDTINPNAMILTHGGRSQTISQWAKELGVHQSTLRTRLTQGWSVERALSERPPEASRMFKTEAHRYLTDLGASAIPEPFKTLLLKDGYGMRSGSGTRLGQKKQQWEVGQHIRRFYPEQFDKWYCEWYVPNRKFITKKVIE